MKRGDRVRIVASAAHGDDKSQSFVGALGRITDDHRTCPQVTLDSGGQIDAYHEELELYDDPRYLVLGQDAEARRRRYEFICVNGKQRGVEQPEGSDLLMTKEEADEVVARLKRLYPEGSYRVVKL